MKNAASLTSRLLKEMRESFFDVSPDGVLVYLDPMIGTMRSLARQLMIRVNSEKSRLELQHRGQTVREFPLAEGARRACEDAFGAYFEKLQEFCKQTPEALAA
jgi:hypothetical protein